MDGRSSMSLMWLLPKVGAALAITFLLLVIAAMDVYRGHDVLGGVCFGLLLFVNWQFEFTGALAKMWGNQ